MSQRSKVAVPELMVKGWFIWEASWERRVEIRERTSETVEVGWEEMESVTAEMEARIGGRAFGGEMCAL